MVFRSLLISHYIDDPRAIIHFWHLHPVVGWKSFYSYKLSCVHRNHRLFLFVLLFNYSRFAAARCSNKLNMFRFNFCTHQKQIACVRISVNVDIFVVFCQPQSYYLYGNCFERQTSCNTPCCESIWYVSIVSLHREFVKYRKCNNLLYDEYRYNCRRRKNFTV